MENDEKLTEIKIDSQKVFDGKILQVYKDGVLLPSGKNSTREYIKHLGAVCIVPITNEGNVILERQFRYPLNRVVTEIPAGKLDSSDEDPLNAAKRELEEETGYVAQDWVYLGSFYPSVAYTTERIWMYMARNLTKTHVHLDEGEFINVFEMPFTDFVQSIMNDEIADGKTSVAVLKAEKYLNRFY